VACCLLCPCIAHAVGINVVVWAYVLGTFTLLVTKQVRLGVFQMLCQHVSAPLLGLCCAMAASLMVK
jgi:hypothetical protein